MAEISREQESGTTWSRKPVPIFIFHQERHLVLLGVLLPAPLYIHVTVSNHNLSNCDFLSVVCCLLDGRDFFFMHPTSQHPAIRPQEISPLLMARSEFDGIFIGFLFWSSVFECKSPRGRRLWRERARENRSGANYVLS